jgi:hypothetical protein
MIKYLKNSLFATLLLFPFAGIGQNCGYNYLGTKALYTKSTGKATSVPADYQPVL